MKGFTFVPSLRTHRSDGPAGRLFRSPITDRTWPRSRRWPPRTVPQAGARPVHSILRHWLRVAVEPPMRVSGRNPLVLPGGSRCAIEPCRSEKQAVCPKRILCGVWQSLKPPGRLGGSYPMDEDILRKLEEAMHKPGQEFLQKASGRETAGATVAHETPQRSAEQPRGRKASCCGLVTKLKALLSGHQPLRA
jgi:hypothetical protein